MSKVIQLFDRFKLRKQSNSHETTRFVSFGGKEQILFARRLSTYLSAGIPILEALAMLEEGASTRSSKHVLSTVLRSISEGNSLSSSLRTFPRQIKRLTIVLIEIGERSGTLNQSLSHLATALQKQLDLQKKLISALIYPAIIIITTIGISTFLVLYAFPKIIPLLKGFSSSLPLSTKILIAISDTGSRYGLLILFVIGAVVVLFIFALRRPSIRLFFDTLLLTAPLIGNFVRSHQLIAFSRTLTVLLKSGAGIVPALELAGQGSGSTLYRKAVTSLTNYTLEGRSIGESMRLEPRCFPIMYTQMIDTGERTGSLPETFALLSEHYEQEFDSSISTLTSLIEPVLMIVMGILVGFIALAIITPVYQITQDIHV